VIDEMLELKKQGDLRGVVVSGCLAERQKETLLEDRPEIDHLVGVFSREEMTKVADRLVGGLDEQRTIFKPAPIRPLPDTSRMRITPRHFAYLKISEGCDRLCTFCAIPKMRGKHATKPMEEVIAEAKELAADGVRELVIVAQDTTYYGMDLYGEPRLAELLRKLDDIEGFDWIRLMYFYPMYIDEELIDVLASSKRIIPYLDMPLQHANNQMLKRMQRRVNREDTETLLARLRERIPNLIMRTTMIVGFPGETDEQFEEMIEFVQKHKFERLGVFTYSFEPDTPAAKLPDQISEEVMNSRRDRLMAVQQEIAFEWNDAQIGRQVEVLIDSVVETEEGEPEAWIGRSYGEAPDVDGVIYVTGQGVTGQGVTGQGATEQGGTGVGISPGALVECEIVARQDYDLIAVACEK